MEPQKKSRFVKGALIIGLVIIINLFFNYTLLLLYPSPQFENFCPNSQIIVPATTQDECVSRGGQWNGNVQQPVAINIGTTPDKTTGYCDLNYTCQNNYSNAAKVYDRNVFMILVVLGALTLTLGIYLFSNNSVLSNSLAYAGVLSFIIASMRYWSDADNLVRVAILALALILLITVAVRKFKD